MKSRFSIIVICLGIVTMFLPGTLWAQVSGKPAQDKPASEMREAPEAGKPYTTLQKEDYVKAAKERLDDLSRRIEELEKRLQEMKGEAQTALQERLRDLKAKRAAAEKRLEELKKTASKTWSDLKISFDAAMQILEDAYDKVKSRFK